MRALSAGVSLDTGFAGWAGSVLSGTAGTTGPPTPALALRGEKKHVTRRNEGRRLS